jgi:hypothetical protein
MPCWVYGRDASNGQPRDPLFLETEHEEDARTRAAEAGMEVDEVEFVKPPEPALSEGKDVPPQEGVCLPEQVASGGGRRCTKCGGGPVEDGFLYSIDSVGEQAHTTFERIGWMAGNKFERRTVGKFLWVIPVTSNTNPRREMTASRCASCGLVELYAQ